MKHQMEEKEAAAQHVTVENMWGSHFILLGY